MLAEISDFVYKKGFELIYLDVTLIAQKPRISNYTEKMKISLSNILNISVNNINIKSTSTDNMGIIGSEKAIASQTIATIKKNYK